MILNKQDNEIYDEVCKILKRKNLNSEVRKDCLKVKFFVDDLKKGDRFSRKSTGEKIETLDGIIKAHKENDLEREIRIEFIPAMIGVGG